MKTTTTKKYNKTKTPTGIVPAGESGVVGFCFRSPNVVRFMLPVTKYVLINVDQRGSVTTPLDTIAGAGKREVVFMHHALAGFQAYTIRCMESSNGNKDILHAHHIVFDTQEQLAHFPEIKVVDDQLQGKADWQVQKTYAERLQKIFAEHRGIDPRFVTTILTADKAYDPEDLIHTDEKMKESERKEKSQSLLHVIQDLQSKNADKRNQIQRLVCGFITGQFIDDQHKLITREFNVSRNGDYAAVKANLISTKHDRDGIKRSLALLAAKFKEIDLVLRQPALDKILHVIASREYVVLMRALLLMQQYKLTVDQASARTGANVCAVALLKREVFTTAQDRVDLTNPSSTIGAVTLVKRAQAQTVSEFIFTNPVLRIWNKYRKVIEVPKQEVDVVPVDSVQIDDFQNNAPTPINDCATNTMPLPKLEVTTGKQKPIAKKTIPPGTYSITDVVVACHLANPNDSAVAILSMSKTSVTFTAPRFKIKGKIVYKLKAGQKFRLHWRSQEYKVRIAEN